MLTLLVSGYATDDRGKVLDLLASKGFISCHAKLYLLSACVHKNI